MCMPVTIRGSQSLENRYVMTDRNSERDFVVEFGQVEKIRFMWLRRYVIPI